MKPSLTPPALIGLSAVLLAVASVAPVASGQELPQELRDYTLEEVSEIARRPHDPEAELPEGLEIFGKSGREWDVRVQFTLPEGDSPPEIENVVEDKVVKGGYFVTSSPMGDVAKEPMYLVTSFDKDAGLYRRFIIIPPIYPEGFDSKMVVPRVLAEMVGLRMPGTSTIAWISRSDDPNQVLTAEEIEDGTISWNSVYVHGGEIQHHESGTSTPKAE